MEPNWEAREAAIAKDLMGGLGWYCDKGGTYDSNPCTSGGTGICKTCEWRKISDPPAYHKNPGAFDRLVRELRKRFDLSIYVGVIDEETGEREDGVHLAEKNGMKLDPEYANNYMQALVLICTEEGRFCPACGEKVVLNAHEFWWCRKCDIEYRCEVVAARVRPELMKGD